ncbi:bifunctional metallophosphatase/5'-nucleotidase [bacterium]|nr:bifunctional metallophosphatase/5'-nucleotidase [bacterium]
MRRSLSVLILMILLTVFLNCETARTSGSGNITILHTNDMHGNFLPQPASWMKTDPKPMIGGFAALEHFVSQIREEMPSVLLLDAGDIMTGNLICNIEYEGAKGGALLHFMNEVGYDAMALGNHEFDNSQENLKRLMEIADFPIVTSNLWDDSGDYFTETGYVILKKAGLRIGVIGAITKGLFGVLNYDRRAGLKIAPAAEYVEKIAAEIDEKTDLILVLSHCGIEEDVEMAKQLSGRVDLIVGGHSHTRLKTPEVVDGILIVQAGSKATNLGRLDITVAGDTIQTYQGKLINLWTEGITPNPELAKEIEFYKKSIDDTYGEKIGDLKSDWIRNGHGEANIGNFLADCLRDYCGADVGLINSGGIRKNMVAGPITLRDINEILPFENYLVTLEMNGDQLIAMMAANAKRQVADRGGILQVSGITYQWQSSKDENVLLQGVTVNGQPVERGKKYKIATIDFVAIANGTRYFGFMPENIAQKGVLIADAVTEIVRNKGVIHSVVEGRIQKLK